MSDSSETTTQDLDPYADNPNVELREHTYDGIQEYDQKLPNWWLWSFYIFIIVFVIYWMLYYQFGFFRTDEERLSQQIEQIEEIKAEKVRKLMENIDEKVLWTMSRTPKLIDEGNTIYTNTCVSCHAPDLTGREAGPQYVGPPLHDDVWVQGGKAMDVFDIVMNGSKDKSKPLFMQAWKDAIGGDSVAKAVAYVLSKHELPEDIDIDG